MNPEEAREFYETTWGKVSDEEWAEISADVEDWDAFFQAKLAAEDGNPADPPAADPPADDPPAADPPEDDAPAPGMSTAVGFEAVAAMSAEMESMRAQMASMTEIVASLTTDRDDMKQAVAKAKWTGEIAGAMFEVDGKQHRIAASGIEVLASLASDRSDENIGALLEHLKLNGGRICTIPTEIAAALAPGKAAADPDDALFADLDSGAIEEIKQIANRHGIPLAQARSRYLGAITGR